MSKSERDTRGALRARLAREHEEQSQLFDAVLNALQTGARDDALRLWSAFDDGLWRHMALEERNLLPGLSQHDPREAEALLAEHEQIRAQLAELGVGVDRHQMRAQPVSDFIERLRQHASREEALAYRWAQEHVPAPQQEELRRAFDAARAVRQRVMHVGRKAKHSVPSAH